MAIVITGATGCVGRYVVERLRRDPGQELVLLVRNPGALPDHIHQAPNITIREFNLVRVGFLKLDGLPELTGAVLAATAWGGPDTRAQISEANAALADALMAHGCRRILYFSTASVLAQDGSLLEAAAEYGTDYIAGKYALTQAMEARAGDADIVGLFPTLVLGGHKDGPIGLSHFGGLLFEVLRWRSLLRWLDAPAAKLHVIHAADIATLVAHWLTTDDLGPVPRRHVLGNPAMTVDALIRAYCAHTGVSRRRLISLNPHIVARLARVLPVQLAEWDRYCMEHPDQSYPGAVCPESYGLPMHMPDIAAGLRDIGLPTKP